MRCCGWLRWAPRSNGAVRSSGAARISSSPVTGRQRPLRSSGRRRNARGCLRHLAGTSVDPEEWGATLSHLPVGHAAVLPPTEEADGRLRQFSLVPRLTPHVRHRQKYVDVPVTESHAFRFNAYGTMRHRQARTLREFVAEIEAARAASLTDYIRRHDFSRWIGEVFGDRGLAAEVARYETRDQGVARSETAAVIADAVRGRYDLTDTEWERGAPPPGEPAEGEREPTGVTS